MSKTIRQLWRDEFFRDGMCILCSDTGSVQTAKRTPGGYTYGMRVPCICPKGRELKTGIMMSEQSQKRP